MIRNLILALAIAGTAAAALAAVASGHQGAPVPDRHLTVIEKNQAFPVLGPLTVEACVTEDCSDTQV